MANMLNPPVELSETDLWKYQKPDVKDKENEKAVLQAASAPEATVVPEMPLAQRVMEVWSGEEEQSGQQEIVPAAVTIQLYGNGGEPSVTTLTRERGCPFSGRVDVPSAWGRY